MEERRLAAIMFTDIVGYTALMGENEPKALQLLERNRKIQKPLIEMYHGQFLKEMGDGMLAIFISVSDAVHCAQQILKVSKEESELKLHIGIHLGEVIFSDGDVFGDGVNIASRIESSAKEGEICISEDVWKNIKNKEDLPVEFIGKRTFKNVKDPVGLYRIKSETSGVKTAPSPSAPRSLSTKQIGLIATLVALFIIAFFVVTEYVLKKRMGTALEVEKSIAVRPFWNESSDQENEYFVNGFVEDIRNNLSKISGLRVISRGSMEKYRVTDLSTSEIADELGVSYILEGTVQKIANTIKIHAQLIFAKTDNHIWEETYERDISDITEIYQIQSTIAREIANELQVEISPQLTQQIERGLTNNPKAYDFYLRGMNSWFAYANRYTVLDLKTATSQLTKATELDPNFAKAYAWLSYFLWHYATQHGGGQPYEDSALVCANKAISIDDQLADAYAIRGWVRWSLKDLNKAVAIDSNSFVAHYNLASYYMIEAELAKALQGFLIALKVDNSRYFDYDAYRHVGNIYSIFFLSEEAKQYYKKTLELQPDNIGALGGLLSENLIEGNIEQAFLFAGALYKIKPETGRGARAYIHNRIGNFSEAEMDLRRSEKEDSQVPISRTGLGFALWKQDQKKEANLCFKEQIEISQRNFDSGDKNYIKSQSSLGLIAIYATIGKTDSALYWLNKFIESKPFHYKSRQLLIDPMFESIREKAEFKAVIKTMQDYVRAERKKFEQMEIEGVL